MPRRGRATRPLYIGLRVRNIDRSIRFYRTLGFRQTIRLRTALGTGVQLEHPARKFTLELNQFRRRTRAYEPYRNGSELDHFGFWVENVDDWVAKLRQVGGKVMMAAYDTPIVIPPRPAFNGRAAYVADPDGIWIELMGPTKRPV